MADVPQKQILTVDGIDQSTLDWLQSPQAFPVTTLAAGLIQEQQWTLVRHPDEFDILSLWIGSHASGVVFMGEPLLSGEQVRQDQEFVMKRMPSDWQSAHLVYLSEEQPSLETTKALQRKERKTLSTKGVTSSAISPTHRTAWGCPSPEIQSALANYSEVGLVGMLERVLGHQSEMDRFLERLREVVPWATYSLITLCLITFCWAEMIGSTTDNWTLLRFGANFAPLTLGAEQWWRLLGAAFLHIGWVHLLVNMYSLYVVGPTLERFFGNLKFIGVYTLSALAGSVASAFFGGGHISAGASGAIFGLFGAAVVLGLRHQTTIPKPIQQQLVRGMLPAIGYNLLFGFTQSGIDNSAHLGGLLAGSVSAALITPRIAQTSWNPLSRLSFALLGLLLLGNQLFVFGQAASGFALSRVPGREVSEGSWRVTLPNMFALAENGDYFEGPGINVDLTRGAAPEGSGAQPPQQLADRLSRDSGIVFSFERTEQINGRTWHFFRSAQNVSGTFALTHQGNEEFGVVAFCSLEYPENGRAVTEYLVSTVKWGPKDPSPGSTN